MPDKHGCRANKGVPLFTSIGVLLLLPALVWGAEIATDNSRLTEAEQLYQSGARAEAKLRYAEAAQQGSAAAHYFLAYRFILPLDERIEHYRAAALQGHQQALQQFLALRFFRANSLVQANPKAALAVYQQAKRANPEIDLYDEQAKVDVLTLAAELPDRDVEAFIETYAIDVNYLNDGMYGIWQLAEQASQDSEQFGKANPELVFWLITRGGDVPAELSAATRDYHRHWQAGKAVAFNLCDYVTSGNGMAFCANRASQQTERQLSQRLTTLKSQLSTTQQQLVDEAVTAMATFVEGKARDEEMHGGSGRAAWIQQSIDEQKVAYLAWLEQTINDGHAEQPHYPQAHASYQACDRQLNQVYNAVLTALAASPSTGELPSIATLRKIQRQWIVYRDANEALLSDVKGTSDQRWAHWLSYQRTTQLSNLLNTINSIR